MYSLHLHFNEDEDEDEDKAESDDEIECEEARHWSSYEWRSLKISPVIHNEYNRRVFLPVFAHLEWDLCLSSGSLRMKI